MAHLHRWALAFLGSGLGGSSVNAAQSAPRQPVRLTDRLASLQGPSEPCARARCRADCTDDGGLARRGRRPGLRVAYRDSSRRWMVQAVAPAFVLGAVAAFVSIVHGHDKCRRSIRTRSGPPKVQCSALHRLTPRCRAFQVRHRRLFDGGVWLPGLLERSVLLRNCSRSCARARSRTRYSASDSGRSLPEARDHARCALGNLRRRRLSSRASKSHFNGDDQCTSSASAPSLDQVPLQSWCRGNVGSDHSCAPVKAAEGSAQPS